MGLPGISLLQLASIFYLKTMTFFIEDWLLFSFSLCILCSYLSKSIDLSKESCLELSQWHLVLCLLSKKSVD